MLMIQNTFDMCLNSITAKKLSDVSLMPSEP